MDKEYCYENTDVLINKLGIRDNEQLHAAERKLASIKISDICVVPVKGNFDLKHLQSIHKAIFLDIYSWAGKIRNVDIAKSNLFCRAQFIDSYSKEIFGRLKQDKYLIGMDKRQAIEKLAEYMGDINALHPFREGNGRTQRQFIMYLAKATGINLDFSKTDADQMMNASLKSFYTDYTGFEQVFNEIASPASIEEQEQFVLEISKEAYKEFDKLRQQELLPDRQAEFFE